MGNQPNQQPFNTPSDPLSKHETQMHNIRHRQLINCRDFRDMARIRKLREGIKNEDRIKERKNGVSFQGESELNSTTVYVATTSTPESYTIKHLFDQPSISVTGHLSQALSFPTANRSGVNATKRLTLSSAEKSIASLYQTSARFLIQRQAGTIPMGECSIGHLVRSWHRP